MSDTARRFGLFATVIALIVFATVLGFSYLQSSTTLVGEANTISSLKQQVSSNANQISTLESRLASATGQTTTVTGTTTSYVTSTYSPGMISVTRPLKVFVGNSTSNEPLAGYTVAFYAANSTWLDSAVTGRFGAAVSRITFTSGTGILIEIFAPGNIPIAEFSLSVPYMSVYDAQTLKTNYVALYLS